MQPTVTETVELLQKQLNNTRQNNANNRVRIINIHIIVLKLVTSG